MCCAVIGSKYRCGNKIFPNLEKDKTCSNFSRDVAQCWKNVKNNTKWWVSNGMSVFVLTGVVGSKPWQAT